MENDKNNNKTRTNQKETRKREWKMRNEKEIMIILHEKAVLIALAVPV